MKKVLALVLAVVMVCTMAMAITVTNTDKVVIGGGTASTTPTDEYAQLVPGSTLVVKFDTTKVNLYTEGTGASEKFVPAKNTVTATFTKGAEWVASQGWVEVKAATTDSITVNGHYYEYQIVLKQDFTKTYNKNVCDLSISAITLRADGYDTQSIFAESKTVKCAYGVGYTTADLGVTVAADGTVTTSPAALASGTIYTVKTIDNNGKPVNSATVALAYPAVGAGLVAEMPVSVGQKVLYASFGNLFTTADTGYTDAGIAASGNARGANNFNTPVKVVFNQGKENAAKVYNVYAKDLSGKITKLAATLDRGVLTFTVPALSYFIVTSDTVTASATQTPTTPGTTTNPGTGANDVVGVAAALAVVALVSGAAISLKK